MMTAHELASVAVTGANVPTLLWASDKELDLALVASPTNVSWNKPDGGLWLSPRLGERSTWIDFMERDSWSPYDSPQLVTQTVKLKSDARILQIDSYDDYAQILSAYLHMPEGALTNLGMFSQLFDFERLAQDWDGIYLTEEGQYATRFSPTVNGPSLYGWDLESLLLFNSECIAEVGEVGTYELKLTEIDWSYHDEFAVTEG